MIVGSVLGNIPRATSSPLLGVSLSRGGPTSLAGSRRPPQMGEAATLPRGSTASRRSARVLLADRMAIWKPSPETASSGRSHTLDSPHSRCYPERGFVSKQRTSDQGLVHGTTMNQVELATLAGGCFWCTEAIFKRVRGVMSVVPGYAASRIEHPSYEQVCTGRTGAAEAVQITYDPAVISYEKLLDIFWHTHDPTTLNRQGNDVGTQYRSAIFYHNAEQERIALASREALERAGTYASPIVTEITAFTNFYPAEDYHRDYYDRHPSQPYCMVVIDPKVQKLLKTYREDLKTVEG